MKRLTKGAQLICAALLCAMMFPFCAFGDETSNAPYVEAASLSNHEYAQGSSEAATTISEESDAIVVDGSSLGFESFTRLNKGTNRQYSGQYYGYRYQMSGKDAFAVVNAQGYSVVYIPTSALDALGASLSDKAFQDEFIQALQAIDTAASNGGQQFVKLNNRVIFTSSSSIEVEGWTYNFGVEVEEDYYYATITQGDNEDCSAGGIYAMSGRVLPADQVSVKAAATGLAALGKFFEKLDWSPLWVSLRTTGVAIIIIFILGLLAAWGTVRVSDKVKGFLDTLFTIPMVLPPTVCGFLLLMLFGNSTGIGRWFISMGIDIVFTWPAAVIACTVVGFPMMYRTVRGAFENLNSDMLNAARTLGWSEGKIFLRLMMPLSWPSIAAGTVLGFARAMGEFGCTLFFAGNFAGITQTLPIAIYYDWMGGQTDVAIFWVIVVILFSFLVILFINIYSSRTQKYARHVEPLHKRGKKGVEAR